MARIKAVLFDLDDTLYDCTGSLLEAARRRAAREMVAAGLPCTESEAYDLQVRLTQEYGPRYPVFDRIAEMFGAGESLIGRALQAYNSDEVSAIEPFPDVVPTLQALRRMGYRLFLLTSGIHRRQERKIELLGIRPLFDEIVIQDKDLGSVREECLLDLLRRNRLAPQEVVAVGDRLHSDIRVANALEMTTVQVLRGRFKDVLPKNEMEEPDFRIEHIRELLDVLASLLRTERVGARAVVALGGGTGLPVVLQGLKGLAKALTAIVTITDSGRSSGMLRRDLGVLPPGDARNCLVALADTEESGRTLMDLFQYRFTEGRLEGMSFGNLFLAALEKTTGGFGRALREASRILAVQGKVIPPTLSNAHVCARLADGTVVREEVNVRAPGKPRIERVFLEPPDVPVNPEAIKEIGRADLVVIGPGSLYTSVIPNLLVPGIAAALRETPARVVYVCNIVTQAGQTDGYTAEDHVRAVLDHLGHDHVDTVLLNCGVPPQPVLERYRAEGADLVLPPGDGAGRAAARLCGIPVVQEDLLERIEPGAPARMLWEKADLLRHHPERLARALMDLA